MRTLIFLAGFALLSVLPSGSSEAAKLGKTCDGIAALQCEEGLWCEHSAGECNVADGSGTCAKKAGAICYTIYLPECGCNGKTYGSDCERKREKAQLDYKGACAK